MIAQTEFVYNTICNEYYCVLVKGGSIKGATINIGSVTHWTDISFLQKVHENGLLNTLKSSPEYASIKDGCKSVSELPKDLSEWIIDHLIDNGYGDFLPPRSDFELAAKFKYDQTSYFIT